MDWGVGLDVGNTHCTTVIASPGVTPVIIEHESVLHHSPDGTVLLGRTDTTSPGVRGFLDRTPASEESATPTRQTSSEELVATALYCMVQQARERTGQPLSVVAAIPATFSPASITALRTSLDNMGLDYIDLVPRSEAVDACDPNPNLTAGELAAWGAATLAAPASAVPVPAELITETEPLQEISVAAVEFAGFEQSLPAEPAPTTGRRPIFIATSVAGLLIAAGCAFAMFVGHTSTTPAPEIRDVTAPAHLELAESAPDPETMSEVPIQFPTAAPITTGPLITERQSPNVYVVEEFPIEDEEDLLVESELPTEDYTGEDDYQSDPGDSGTEEPTPTQSETAYPPPRPEMPTAEPAPPLEIPGYLIVITVPQ